VPLYAVGEPSKQRIHVFLLTEYKELTRLRLNPPTVSNGLDLYHKPVMTRSPKAQRQSYPDGRTSQQLVYLINEPCNALTIFFIIAEKGELLGMHG
jgi:hypothetical protein